ncbi:hypothetical protein RJT34_13750 [Clitoria ternatea]|uniref:Uncharacterized protein n=1 Tax=Clitoria ternatea TaxID=43366 RepID=A0AAN9PM41_CLITE
MLSEKCCQKSDMEKLQGEIRTQLAELESESVENMGFDREFRQALINIALSNPLLFPPPQGGGALKSCGSFMIGTGNSLLRASRQVLDAIEHEYKEQEVSKHRESSISLPNRFSGGSNCDNGGQE